MTRGQMKQRARSLLQTGRAGLLASDPFTADSELDEAANEICKATDCFFREFTSDLTAGKSSVCPPLIYKITGVYGVDDSGLRYELSMNSTRQQNNNYYLWRMRTSDVNVTGILMDGMNRMTVVPTPSVSRAGALIISGFSVASDISEDQTFHLWRSDSDECPLPQEAHQAVLYKYIENRLMQMMANPETAAVAASLLPLYRQRCDEERGRLEAFAAQRYSTVRRGDRAFYGGGYY